MQLSRRSAIGLGALGVATVAVAGCHDSSSPQSAVPKPPPVPDASALATAVTDELELLASYDHLIKHSPVHRRGALQVERAIHATHLGALHGIETTTKRHHVSVNASLAASARRLRRLALAAELGSNAALLASIAASHTASLS